MTEYGPICPKLALSQIARYEIRKQTSPLERFRDPPLPLSGLLSAPPPFQGRSINRLAQRR